MLKRIAIGFAVCLPLLAVAAVYRLVGSWFESPASEILRIPIINRLFGYVPFLAFLQPVLGVVIVLALVAVIFFLIGTFVMTWVGKKMRYRVERHLLSFLPFYKFFKNVAVLFVGENGDVSFLSRFEQSAFVHPYGNETFMSALVTAGIDDTPGVITAYVPSVPNVTAGRVYNVPLEWSHFLDIPAADFVTPVAAWGIGTGENITRYVAGRIARGALSPECFLGERCPIEREVQHAFARLRSTTQT